MLPSSHRLRPDTRASTLPEDVLYEILLRIPAKDLCRLRCVCRAWRSLLSDPHFVVAHPTCHPEPLIVVGYERTRPDRVLCDIMDLSGHVVKRVLAGSENEWVMRAQLDLICVVTDSTMSCQLLDPATGAIHALPEGLAAEHVVYGLNILDYTAMTALGLVASTGEYKVLRVLEATPDPDWHPCQLYEVFTLDHGNSQACWRAKKAPPYRCSVELHYTCSVVMDGIVYFLLSDNGWDHSTAYPRDLVAASFDLETEEWGATIRGPLSSPKDHGIGASSWSDFSMAVLSASVVLGHGRPSCHKVSPSIDLWFLIDSEKGLWVKKHSIQISNLYGRPMVQPLLVLSDGRIILHHVRNIGISSFLKIYDPGSKTCMDVVKMDHHYAVGLYRGNLLGLPNHTS
ncbi:unnamed protein product [Urochloa decumbens]|uniref:F-box domain-containing protein n=1 Tax=Urochloa decumbens TaxID=240449 RepID=A0ABC9GA88_9POAL